MAFDTTELLASVRQRAMLPDSTATGTDTTSLLRIATEEIRTRLGPYVLSAQEQYLVIAYDYAITSGTSSYRIPPRAIGGKLHRVEVVDSSGKRSELDLISPSASGDYQVSGTPRAYYIENNNVIVVPAPNATQNTLRLRFYLRQADLVEASLVATVEAINTATRQVTVSAIGTIYPSSGTYDFIKADGGCETLAIDQTATRSSLVLTFTNALPANLAVGDYVARAGQSCVPGIPADLHPVLYQRVAVKVLESIGDTEGLENARRQLQEMEQSCLPVINPRVDGQQPAVVDNRLLTLLGW